MDHTYEVFHFITDFGLFTPVLKHLNEPSLLDLHLRCFFSKTTNIRVVFMSLIVLPRILVLNQTIQKGVELVKLFIVELAVHSINFSNEQWVGIG